MRLDILTSDWHKLLKPVLPHAAPANDPSLSLQAVRLELGATALYAVATDRYTMGAERYELGRADRGGDWPPVHIAAGDAKATLKLLTHGKDYDPELRVTVDRAALPAGPFHTIDGWAVKIERPDDGTKMTLRDRRDPSLVDSLANWKTPVVKALTRARGKVLDGLDVQAYQLARWKDAVRGTERLRVWTGPKRGDTILVTVERHFAGVMVTDLMLDDPSRDRSELPWTAELLPEGVSVDGEKTEDDA